MSCGIMSTAIGFWVWRPLVLAVAAASLGCSPKLGEFKYRERQYEPAVTFAEEHEQPAPGSLWTASALGNRWVKDSVARAVGDVVTVLVREEADARRGASNETNRDSAMSNVINDFLAIAKLVKPELAGLDLLNSKATADFKGTGTSTRTERLQATVPATVKKVLPNGNLFIEGHRTILVNTEENHFYISGVVRPADITDDNVIPSSRIAEAEIMFNGRGNISDTIQEPYLQRALKKYSPF